MSIPYDEPENLCWQTRVGAEPSEYARALADALERIFGEGVEDLDVVVARLNESGPPPEGVAEWTRSVFEAEMVRLGPERGETNAERR